MPPLFTGAFSAWGTRGTAARRDPARQFFTPGDALGAAVPVSAPPTSPSRGPLRRMPAVRGRRAGS